MKSKVRNVIDLWAFGSLIVGTIVGAALCMITGLIKAVAKK